MKRHQIEVSEKRRGARYKLAVKKPRTKDKKQKFVIDVQLQVSRENTEETRQQSQLPMIDVVARAERCVILLAHELGADGQGKLPGLVAWYPEKGEAGLVSNSLLPPGFIPMDSCRGFVCGMHAEFLYDYAEWKFRVAVCNPVTNYLAELPILDVTHLDIAETLPPDAYDGEKLMLKMTPALHGDKDYNVHFATSYNGTHTVHTFNTTLWRWESSTSPADIRNESLVGELLFRYRNLRCYDVASRKWTAIAGPTPGKPWDADYPIPERFSGSKFRNMFPFRHGQRIMAACTLSTCDFVLLELKENREWKVVVCAGYTDFKWSLDRHPSGYHVKWPYVRGDLLVLPCFFFDRPLALDLEHYRWMEVPLMLGDSGLAFQCTCIYEP